MWGALVKTVVVRCGRFFSGKMGKSVFSSLGTRASKIFSMTGRYAKKTVSSKRTTGIKGAVSAKYSTFKNWAKVAYDKSPSWLKSGIGFLASTVAYNYVEDWLMADSADGNEGEDAEIMAALLSAQLGVASLKEDAENADDEYVSSANQTKISTLVRDLMHSKKALIGVNLVGDLDSRLEELTFDERVHMINMLQNFSKRVAFSSTGSGLLNSYRIQACLAGEIASHPTKAFSSFKSENSREAGVADAIAMEHIAVFGTILDDIREDTTQDFFDENTSLFSGDFNPDLKKFGPFGASILAIDEPVSGLLGSWSEWKVDEDDATDDETIVRNMLDTYSMVSDGYKSFLSKLVNRRLGYDEIPSL